MWSFKIFPKRCLAVFIPFFGFRSENENRLIYWTLIINNFDKIKNIQRKKKINYILPTGTGAANFAFTSLSLLGLVNIEPNPMLVFTVFSEVVVDVPVVDVTDEFFCFFLLYVRLVVLCYFICNKLISF